MVDSTDLALVIPDYSLGEAAWFCAVLLVTVLAPGHVLRRRLGLLPGGLWERWALTAVLGTLWTSLAYFALAAGGWQRFHILLAPLPFLIDVVRRPRRWFDPRRRASFLKRIARRPARPILVGLLLAAVLAAGYFAKTAALVRRDADGLRLYGALYSDKMTNMSPSAALRHAVPPAALRISGYVFPSHYFPHLFVASFDVGAGIDYLDGFWFYAAAFGVAVRSFAVLGFAKRWLRSPWLACLALAIFGFNRFTPQDKTLDLSFALLLLAIGSLDRHRAARRSRWLAWCVVLVAAMPCYEVFTAAARLVVSRRGQRAGQAGAAPAWREVRLRAATTGAACLGCALAVNMLYLGARLESPPQIKFKNVYLASYADEWRDRLRAPDPPGWLAQIYAWKRGKPVAEVVKTGSASAPGPLEEIAGEAIYHAGFAGYFVLRFVNLALLGVVALAARRRSNPGDPAVDWVASIAAVGYAVPCVLVWGHTAGGQWWETPNIYRLTTCAWMLLAIGGTGVLVQAVREIRRPKWWIPLAIAGWQVWLIAAAYAERPRMFHLVPPDRLAALAFLRTGVPEGQVVLHPWIHDLIRSDARPAEVAWVYKRHFTLGSNLAGCQMYYEGREDHLFINGFVRGEEVYRRRRLRDRFYASPDEAVVRAVVGEGGVRWIVADADSPPPLCIQEAWPVVFQSGTVRIYAR